MPKSIWFPDKDFEQLVALAKQKGFRVSRGRGSQLRSFVMAAANNCVQSDELACDDIYHDFLLQWEEVNFCDVCGTPIRR